MFPSTAAFLAHLRFSPNTIGTPLLYFLWKVTSIAGLSLSQAFANALFATLVWCVNAMVFAVVNVDPHKGAKIILLIR